MVWVNLKIDKIMYAWPGRFGSLFLPSIFLQISTINTFCLYKKPVFTGTFFKKLINNRIVDHLEKCGLFSDFQYDLRYSRSTADLLTLVSG